MLFGSPGGKYSPKERPISIEQIKTVVSRSRIQSLDGDEEKLIEQVIEKRRRGDGKISMRQIDEVLRKLVADHAISPFDREGVIKAFEQFFGSK